MENTARHSRYLDGFYPGQQYALTNQGSVGHLGKESEEGRYIQPAMETVDAGQASEEASKPVNICQRATELGIYDWIMNNQSTLIKVAAVYGVYRILKG